MKQISIQHHKTKLGEFILGEFEGLLCLLDFTHRRMRSRVDKRLQTGLQAEFIEKDSPLLQQTRSQLDAFLGGEIQQFELPLLTVGSEFQEQVWHALQQIPYGETCSYLELARSMGKESAVRAVANANGANALAIVIPCHRVVETSGGLGGYGGGVPVKKRLLKLEAAHANTQLSFA